MTHESIVTTELEPGMSRSVIGRVGRWVSAQGVTALAAPGADSGTDVGPCGVDDPRQEVPATGRETQAIFAGLREGLERVGLDLADVVRVDQYYPSASAVPAHQAARRGLFTPHVPPSTSIVVEGTISPSCTVSVDALAVDGRPARRPILDPNSPAREASGWAPALEVDGLVFFSGQLPHRPTEGIAADATRHPQHAWGFHELLLQTRHVLAYMRDLAESAGVAPDGIVASSLFVRDIADMPYVSDLWNDHFGGTPPARTVVPCLELGLRPALIEINMVGVQDHVDVERREPRDDHGLFPGDPSSVRAGDLVFLSGMHPWGGARVPASVSRARADSALRSSAREQASLVVDRVEEELQRHGLGLEHLLRIVHHHTDLRDLREGLRVWSERLDGRPVPLSAIQVSAPLPVRHATLMVDCWAAHA